MLKIEEKLREEIFALIGEAHFPNTPCKIVNAILNKLGNAKKIEEKKPAEKK